MKITPIAHGLEDLIGKSIAPRSSGLHMSQIYGDLYQDLEPGRFKRESLPDPLLLEAGLAWETMLEEGLCRRLCGERPGEFMSPEGIAFSPDFIIFNGFVTVGEFKLTWLSSRDVPRDGRGEFPPKFDKYFVQLKAYCHCLNTQHGRLIVFFVNNSYDRKRPPGPELLAWDLTFSQQELEENWSMLINHAKSKGML